LDKTITFWDATTGAKIRDLGSLVSPVWDLSFSPDGTQLASATLASDVCLWEVNRGETIWCYNGEKAYLSAALSPSGKTVAYGGRWGDAGVLDGDTGKRIVELIKLTNPVGDVMYSAAGKMLAAGTDDSTIYLWNTENYQSFTTFQGHQGYVNGVSFSPDETLLISGSHDKRIGIWSIAEQKLIKMLDGHRDTVLRVTFSPDGKLIASISWDGTVRLWGTAAK
jgi:WD40 repeat protein